MQPAEPQARRILVVDDNQSVARSLLNLLKSEGLDPMVFQSGQPALDYLQKNCPDAALIDIHLPDISGIELTRQLRKTHGSDLPVIICSGDSSIDTLDAIREAGATLYFHKPVSVSKLVDCLKKSLATAAKQTPPS